MNVNINKSFLYTGRDLRLGDNLIVKHPKIKDIVALNNGFFCDDIYLAYVQNILSDPYLYMVFLDDMGIDYESVKAIDVLALRWKNPQEKAVITESLSFFLGERDYALLEIDGNVVIYDPNDKSFAFGSVQFEWIVKFIAQINCVSDEGRINPATQPAKKILIEDMRDEIKRFQRKTTKEKDHGDYIGDSITALLYGGSSGITPFNFEELSVFQLLYGASSVQKKMRVGSLLNGIYTGAVNSEKIPQENFRWT